MLIRWFLFPYLVVLLNPIRAQEVIDNKNINKLKFKQELEKLTQLQGLKGASISWCFRNAADGKELEAYNAGLMLIPASVAKLYTSTAALDLLGPAFRFKTSLWMHGEIHRGRLSGDLIVNGAGDPSLGHGHQKVLGIFSKALSDAGVKKIRGRIEADPHRFPYDYRAVPNDRVWEDVANYYGGGVYGINWRNNSVAVRFSAQSDTVLMRPVGPFDYPGTISNKVKTAGQDAEIGFFPEPFSDRIDAAGNLSPKTKNAEERMALPNPPLQMIRELYDTLQREGIEVRRGYAVSEQLYTPGKGDSLLAEFSSAPLEELLKEVNSNSNNLYAEAIARRVGMQLGSEGSAEDACVKIRKSLINKGFATDTLFILREGSGLGRKNLVTTSGMTGLLCSAYKQSWFPAFEGSLAEPGKPGTLASFRKISGLKAKTGSISGVRAFAGYFTDAGGNKIAFSIIINNYFDGSAIRRQIEQILEMASKSSLSGP